MFALTYVAPASIVMFPAILHAAFAATVAVSETTSYVPLLASSKFVSEIKTVVSSVHSTVTPEHAAGLWDLIVATY